MEAAGTRNTSSSLQVELDEAIENWRQVWKSGDMDRLMQLYSEDVRVMRAGRELLVGREQLRPTMEQLRDLGWADIHFYSDEVGGITTGGESSLAYQRYHEPLVRDDGSEIATVYGLMIWRKVSGYWLIDVYANCPSPSSLASTDQLKSSIQQSFNQLGEAMASQDLEEVLKYFSNDCKFMPPGEQLNGKPAIKAYLEQAFKQKGYRRLVIDVESVMPMVEDYVVSRMVHVTYPSFRVLGETGEVVLGGCGNAVLRGHTSKWEIVEALWNAIPQK